MKIWNISLPNWTFRLFYKLWFWPGIYVTKSGTSSQIDVFGSDLPQAAHLSFRTWLGQRAARWRSWMWVVQQSARTSASLGLSPSATVIDFHMKSAPCKCFLSRKERVQLHLCQNSFQIKLCSLRLANFQQHLVLQASGF